MASQLVPRGFFVCVQHGSSILSGGLLAQVIFALTVE